MKVMEKPIETKRPKMILRRSSPTQDSDRPALPRKNDRQSRPVQLWGVIGAGMMNLFAKDPKTELFSIKFSRNEKGAK